jgi:hypothetical protein
VRAGTDVWQVLRKCARDVEGERRKLEQAVNQIWEHPPGAMGAIRIDHRYRTRPTREDHLDTLFQIRLALILRLYLPKAGYVWVPKRASKKARRVFRKKEGISRRTIARLVVLTYMVDGLANVHDGHLYIGKTKKRLTVPNVEQRLKRAGVDDMEQTPGVEEAEL